MSNSLPNVLLIIVTVIHCSRRTRNVLHSWLKTNHWQIFLYSNVYIYTYLFLFFIFKLTHHFQCPRSAKHVYTVSLLSLAYIMTQERKPQPKPRSPPQSSVKSFWQTSFGTVCHRTDYPWSVPSAVHRTHGIKKKKKER